MEELPVNCSLGVIGPLLRKLRSLTEAEPSLPEEVSKDELRSFTQDLEEAHASVMELSKEDPSFTAKCLMKEMREICYDAEDYLDMVLHSSADVPEEDVSELRARLQGAKKRRERCQKIFELRAPLQQDAGERRQRCQFALDGFQTIVKSMLQTPHEVLDKPMNKLVDLLAFDSEPLFKVVPIFGPAGVGKTTLARIFYHRYGGKFHCRAFLRVSRNPDTRRLLTSMLSQIKAPRAQGCSDVQDLTNKVNKHLRGKTYLIIVDDLWATSAWDIISRAFPEGDRCGRIITTTQIENVALACCSYHSNNMYEMRPLSDGQPQELFFGTSEGMKEVTNLIYNNLPSHLKTCLLYLNMYPEDYVIQKDDLVKQWVAEGFLGAVEGKNREEVAGGYFQELVATGMIQPVDVNYNNDVVSCTVHHMVLDLIACQSMEENFITVVDYFETVTGLPDKVRRLSLKFGGAKSAQIPGSFRMTQARSLLFSGFFRCVPSIVNYRLIQVLILDVWADQGKTSFDLTGIRELFLLRYLKIACNIAVTLPELMGGLQFLETLEVHARVNAVPLDIVRLQRLLHLRLPDGTDLPHGIGGMTSLRTIGYVDLSSNSEDNVLNLCELTNLQDLHLTCSTVPSDDLEKNMESLGLVLGKLSNLKCLAMLHAASSHSDDTLSETDDDPNMIVSCDGLINVSPAPTLLQRFEMSLHYYFSKLPSWAKELRQLRVLNITVWELSGDDFDVLGGLPALTALSLYIQIALTEKIVFGKEGFLVLKYFQFWCRTVPQLKFEADALPNLQKLELGFNAHGLYQHSDPPISIEHLSGLKEITVKMGGADANGESALTAAISNHPRNPSIIAQSVDWMFYGNQCRSMGTKEKQQKALEEDVILEEDSDECYATADEGTESGTPEEDEILDEDPDEHYLTKHDVSDISFVRAPASVDSSSTSSRRASPSPPPPTLSSHLPPHDVHDCMRPGLELYPCKNQATVRCSVWAGKIDSLVPRMETESGACSTTADPGKKTYMILMSSSNVLSLRRSSLSFFR